MAGRMINGAAALAELVRAAGETETSGVHRVLPVTPELSGLLPGRGLRRGSTVAVTTGLAAQAGGGTSLLLALLAETSRSGSWCAVVGVPSLGALAAAEAGIALDRLALVPNPGPDWPTVVAALIDGVDVVVTAVPGGVSSSIASRLAARARQRGSVLVPFGPWSGADVTLRVVEGRWEGLAAGHGRLRRREVTVRAQGRGAAARPKEMTMWMPGLTARPITLPPAPSTTGPGAPPAPPGRPALVPTTPPEQSPASASTERPASASAGRAGSASAGPAALEASAVPQPAGRAAPRSAGPVSRAASTPVGPAGRAASASAGPAGRAGSAPARPAGHADAATASHPAPSPAPSFSAAGSPAASAGSDALEELSELDRRDGRPGDDLGAGDSAARVLPFPGTARRGRRLGSAAVM